MKEPVHRNRKISEFEEKLIFVNNFEDFLIYSKLFLVFSGNYKLFHFLGIAHREQFVSVISQEGYVFEKAHDTKTLSFCRQNPNYCC